MFKHNLIAAVAVIHVLVVTLAAMYFMASAGTSVSAIQNAVVWTIGVSVVLAIVACSLIEWLSEPENLGERA